MFAFFKPKPRCGFGEAGGMTAGSGIEAVEGAGEAERRTRGEALPMEDRLLCVDIGGGSMFMDWAREFGVPGVNGTGDATR